jgi:Cysteine rich repeat
MAIRQFKVGALSLVLASSLGSAGVAQEAVMKYCKPDVERLCPGVPPGGGRIIGCLKEHKMEVSVGCAQALKKIKEQMGK